MKQIVSIVKYKDGRLCCSGNQIAQWLQGSQLSPRRALRGHPGGGAW